MIVGYLGPEGTFSEQAGLYYIDSDSEKKMYPSISDLLFAVSRGEADKGIVPIENSIEGTVTQAIDTLIFDVDLYIQSEYILPISYCLLSKKNNKSFNKIISHPQALGQCRNFIFNNYPHCEVLQANSTAEAARIVSESEGNIAAISAMHCAELYGLEILHNKLEDRKHNMTRFIEVSKTDSRYPFPGCKTSIVFSAFNRPGELYKILDIFPLWDINMTKIESRPMKNNLGEYVFFVDLEGTQDKKDMIDALSMVERKSTFFKNMGSYKKYLVSNQE